jgi:hypothetical protein
MLPRGPSLREIIMIELLEPFSRQMAEDLFSVFPSWTDHLSVISEAGENYLKVLVPAPAESKGGPLEVYSSDDQEVTVCYAGTHGHFLSVLGDAQGTDGAIGFIRKIVDEQCVVVSYIWLGDATVQAGFISSGSVPADKIPRANYKYYYTTSMRVRSWRGNYDAEFAAPYIKNKPVGTDGDT